MTMHVPSAAAIILQRKSPPPLVIVSWIIVPIFFLGIWSTIFQTHQYEITAFALFMFGLFLLTHYGVDRGYQLAWDDAHMYMRDWNYRWFLRRYPWRSMAYADVVAIEGKFKNNSAMKSAFMPFEYILVSDATYDDKQAIWIHPPSFPDSEVKAFLKHLAAKRPDLVPQDIIDFANSDQPL